MICMGLAQMRRAHPIHVRTGRSDFLDALAVAADVLVRALKDRPQLESNTVAKRMLFISNFQQPVEEDGKCETGLVRELSAKNIQLDVMVVGKKGADEARGEASNEAVLARILPGVRHSLRRVCGAAELLAVAKFKEYEHGPYYAGELTFGGILTIAVKVGLPLLPANCCRLQVPCNCVRE